MWNIAQNLFNQLTEEQRRELEQRINTHITHYQRMPMSVCSPMPTQDLAQEEQDESIVYRPK